ncbi:MAG TPA: hypothetical protein VN259_02320 [Xanthomonadales bacterium]|nr:hypothetical protein [Xanthomonadales bacterium]
MMRNLLLSVTLAIGTGLLPLPLQAQSTPIRGAVEMRVYKPLDEIADYVAAVDRRLKWGRYDLLKSRERVWMNRQIALIRAELARADARNNAQLQVLAGEFEVGVIRLEEGAITCRSERTTGTRFEVDRCYSQKRLREDEERSRDAVRDWQRLKVIAG